MRINIFCPHIWPDTAPTGEVMRQLLERWAARGNECHVITTLPWYRDHRVEPKWRGSAWHLQETSWGSVLRLHPLAPATKKKTKANLALRAAGFGAFATYAAAASLAQLRRADVAFAMSPPLTLSAAAGLVCLIQRTPLVLNLQDLHPDAARLTGAVTSPSSLAALGRLEAFCYRRAAAITVLSPRTEAIVATRAGEAKRTEVIPNFVSAQFSSPQTAAGSFRAELGIDEDAVVFLYAGNVGYSQPLGLVRKAARALARRRDISFVINGSGAAMAEVEQWASQLDNVFVSKYQPPERLREVLAAGDVHLVPLAAGLGAVSVPSKVYAALEVARPILACVDADSEIAAIVTESGAGEVVGPDSADAFVDRVVALADDPARRAKLGRAAARYSKRHSPDAAARSYLELFAEVAGLG